MPTRNISLTKQLDEFVEETVADGEYQNASEVMRDALRLLQERRREEKIKLQKLREAVDVGIAAIERGDYIDLKADEVGPWLASLGKAKKGKKRRRR